MSFRGLIGFGAALVGTVIVLGLLPQQAFRFGPNGWSVDPNLAPGLKQDARKTDPRARPEAATGRARKDLVRARSHMIVSANPLASQAGMRMLEKGGSAVDAAIAAQLVLGLVEPQSSGIGGGAFLLHFEKLTGDVLAYDGRETAPQAAQEGRFLDETLTPMPWKEARKTGRAVGVPGLVKLMALTHQRYGRLAWKDLFEPAIGLARDGFKVSPRLNKMLAETDPALFNAEARAYFYDEAGVARPVGYVLKNPAYAATLTQMAKDQGADFYGGALAKQIVEAVFDRQQGGGRMVVEDLSGYVAKIRAPVCVTYRTHQVCGMGPPSSGAHTVGQTLMLLDGLSGFGAGKPMEVGDLHLVAEAQKLAYADRGRYLADTDFVDLPEGYLTRAYLDARRKLISASKSMGKAEAGSPPDAKKTELGRDGTQEGAGTTHISVVDATGNALSMTSSIESAFGAYIMVGGFLLNNQLTDFSFKPLDESGRPIANRVEAGKRPRSSMSPTLVFEPSGELKMVTGSPGGSRIITYVVKSIVGHLDWGLDAQQIADLPNFGSRNGPFELEAPEGLDKPTREKLDRLQASLEALGHKVQRREMTSGLHAIIVSKGDDGQAVLTGGADPRREGLGVGK